MHAHHWLMATDSIVTVTGDEFGHRQPLQMVEVLSQFDIENTACLLVVLPLLNNCCPDMCKAIEFLIMSFKCTLKLGFEINHEWNL